MLPCHIVGLAQDMDFEDNVSQTFVVLQLSDGQRVRAAVDDDTAEIVVRLQVNARGAPRSVARRAAPPPAAYEEAEAAAAFAVMETADGAVTVFGGQDNAPSTDYDEPPAEEDTDAEDLPVIDDPDPEPERATRDANPKKTERLARGQAVPGRGKQNLFRTAKGKLVAPSRTIPKNEAGYPQVPGGGIDPEALTTNRNQDEDGVGSI